jgi:hypothetical protein
MDFPFFWVSFGVVVATAVWVAVDARVNRVPTYGDRYDMNTGAFCWFLGCLLLWIFAFPAYWVRRYSVLRNRAEHHPSLEEENRRLQEQVSRLKLKVTDLIDQQGDQAGPALPETEFKTAVKNLKEHRND